MNATRSPSCCYHVYRYCRAYSYDAADEQKAMGVIKRYDAAPPEQKKLFELRRKSSAVQNK